MGKDMPLEAFKKKANEYVKFTEKFDRKPSIKSENTKERNLGCWMGRTISAYKDKKLSENKVEVLKKYNLIK